MIFKYNANAKYSTKDLKGVYNSNNFWLLHVRLDEKGKSVKSQLQNIFEDHHIAAQAKPAANGYDEWPLSLTLWRNFYNSHGKYKPELNEYFHIDVTYILPCLLPQAHLVFLGNILILQTCLYALQIVLAVYRFHVYLHVPWIHYTFLFHMKMGLAKLKMIMIKVHITVYAMSTVYNLAKRGCMETGFIQ